MSAPRRGRSGPRRSGSRMVDTNTLDHGSSTPLMQAVLRCDLTGVTSYLEQRCGVDTNGFSCIDEQRSDGATALLLAVRMQNFEIVRELLRLHANPCITAHGWRWDACARLIFMGDPLEDTCLRRLEHASPLMVAVMTRMQKTRDISTIMRDGGDKIVRALIFCGGLGAELDEFDNADGDEPEGAKEELSLMALRVLSQAELCALFVEGDHEDPGVFAKRLLGFDPTRRSEPWMDLTQEERDTEFEESMAERQAAIEDAVAARIGDTSHLSGTDMFLAQVFHQLAMEPTRLLDKVHEQGINGAARSAMGGGLGTMIAVAHFLTADHSAKTLRQTKEEGVRTLEMIAGDIVSEAMRDSFRRNLAQARTHQDIVEGLRQRLLQLEQEALRGGRGEPRVEPRATAQNPDDQAWPSTRVSRRRRLMRSRRSR